MKFLSADIPNQISLEVKVRGEVIPPLSNITGRLILDGVLLSTVDISVNDNTNYFLTVPPIAVIKGQVKNLRVQLNATTAIGVYKFNSVYHIIDYLDIPVDYEAIRNKLGVLEEEVNDWELNLESTYLNSFKIFNQQLFLDRDTDPTINYLYSRYIILAAAISSLPTLLIRLAKQDKTENGEFVRLANANNLQDFLVSLQGELRKTLDLLNIYIDSDLGGTGIFQFITISPDLITGT